MARIRPWFWELCNTLSKVFVTAVRLDLEVRVEGEVPRGAVLVTAKHASSFDISVLADLCRRLHGRRPYFQMGSFVGYRVLGAITPFLRWLGAFPVMRPKDLRRLIASGTVDRRAALEQMKRINEEAEATRRELLMHGEILVVFPEGTRSSAEVLPLRSPLEIETAIQLVSANDSAVQVWPAVLSYGPRRFFRRRARFHFLPAFPLTRGDTAGGVLERLSASFEAHWIPPSRLAERSSSKEQHE